MFFLDDFPQKAHGQISTKSDRLFLNKQQIIELVFKLLILKSTRLTMLELQRIIQKLIAGSLLQWKKLNLIELKQVLVSNISFRMLSISLQESR